MMKTHLLGLCLIIFKTLFLPSLSHAQDAEAGWCGSIFRSVQVGCGDLVRSNSVGGSFPLLFDAFNVNPASIPNYPTPVGVEAFMANRKINYSLIKGTKGVGFGSSIGSTKNTFFSPTSNLETTFLETQTATESSGDYEPNVNFGTSIALFGKKGSFIQSSLGGSIQFNKEAKNFDYEGGIVFKTRVITLGATITQKADKEVVYAYSAGVKMRKFFIDYTYFEAVQVEKVITKILSFNYTSGGLQLSYAYRRQVNPFVTDVIKQLYIAQGNEYDERHGMLGINYRFNDTFSLGFFTNYVLNEGSSFTVQYLF